MPAEPLKLCWKNTLQSATASLGNGRRARAKTNWKTVPKISGFAPYGRLCIQPRGSQTKRKVTPLYPLGRAAQGLGSRENRPFSTDCAFQPMDRPDCTLLVDAENTDHPTQNRKTAGQNLWQAAGPAMCSDPLGSGTTSVTAKKLARRYIGIEQDRIYCCLAEKRLQTAETDKTIQGYSDGVFWERNAKKKGTIENSELDG